VAAHQNQENAIAGGDKEFSWSFWTFDWERPPSGRHTIRSRAFGDHGMMPDIARRVDALRHVVLSNPSQEYPRQIRCLAVDHDRRCIPDVG